MTTRPSAERTAGVVPAHLGVIPDGNRRWARSEGVPVIDGHRRGAAKTLEVLHWCEHAGIRVVTVWALSSGNIARTGQLSQMLTVIEELVAEIVAAGRWQFGCIGNPGLLEGESLPGVLDSAQCKTAGSDGMRVNLAVAYDGREDILTAVRTLLAQHPARHAPGSALTVKGVSAALESFGSPDCDLVLRTSGEYRLSGFMPWQAAQAELYFSQQLWPEFTREDFDQALTSFAARDRRFGA